MFRVLNSLLVVVAFLSCSTEQEALPEWIIGSWQIGEGQRFEIWEQKDVDFLSGISFLVEGKDTTVSESMDLVKRDGEVLYIPTVFNQNDGKPVEFKLINQQTRKLIFENKLHDFPQQIIYELIDQKSILVTIQGLEEDGSTKDIDFNLRRIN